MWKHIRVYLLLLLFASGCGVATTSSLGEATRTPTTTPTLVPSPTALAIDSTSVILFTPVGIQGETVEGDCWTGSIAVWRAGAWRCMVGNRIYDPCFSIEGDTTEVICGATPQNNGIGFPLKLTKALPTPSPLPKGQHAWMLELADGTTCGFLQGATKGFDGKRLNYGCSGSWYILGELQANPVWTAEKVMLSGDGSSIAQSALVQIRTAWQ